MTNEVQEPGVVDLSPSPRLQVPHQIAWPDPEQFSNFAGGAVDFRTRFTQQE